MARYESMGSADPFDCGAPLDASVDRRDGRCDRRNGGGCGGWSLRLFGLLGLTAALSLGLRAPSPTAHVAFPPSALHDALRNVLEGARRPDPSPRRVPTQPRVQFGVRPLDPDYDPLESLAQRSAEFRAGLHRRADDLGADLRRRAVALHAEWEQRVAAAVAAFAGPDPNQPDGTAAVNTEDQGEPAAAADATAAEGTGEEGMEEGEAGGGPTEWVCHSMWYESPRYTGIVWLPIRRNEGADIECMSLNARDCGWQKEEGQCKTILEKHRGAKNLRPLVCGEMHQRLWKETGYDKPGHWCETGRKLFAKAG